MYTLYCHSIWVLIYFQKLCNFWKMFGCWLVDLALNHLSCLKKRRSWSERERKHTVRGQGSPWSDEWLNVHWLWASDSSVLFHIPLPKALLHKTVAAAHLEQFHNVLRKWVKTHDTRCGADLTGFPTTESCLRVSLVPRSLVSSTKRR